MTTKPFVHPLEDVVEQFLKHLGVDAKKATFDSGTSFDFEFGGTSAEINLPVYVPGRDLNVIRIEFTVGRIQVQEAGKALFIIAADIDTNQTIPVRVAVRPAGRMESQFFLVFVCPVDDLPEALIANVIIQGLDLSDCYRAILEGGTTETRLAS